MSARLHKYAHLVETAARERLRERSELIGRALFMAMLLLIFSRLWSAIEQRGALAGQRGGDFVWYLAVTEWILLSQPALWLEIEEDVRSGRLAYLLSRPISYLGATLARGAGDLLARLAALGPCAALAAFLLSGGFPSSPEGLLLAMPFGFAASLVLLCCYSAIGLSAFWIHDAKPVYWIWQKLAFVFGGLLVPLHLYPDWLRALAGATPFPTLMYGPARLVLGVDASTALSLFGALFAWALVLLLAVLGVYRRALAALELGGG